ncbi:MAG TPA: DUF177 domain-containing protein [Actinomycetota bacterium]
MEGLAVPMAGLAAESGIRIELTFESLVDGILATGTIGGRADARCRRCLRELAVDVVAPVREVFTTGAARDADTYPIEHGRADLEQMARDLVLPALPLDPLCRPNCAGLCPVCGADRNAESCGHDQVATDGPWAPLADLRDRLEE